MHLSRLPIIVALAQTCAFAGTPSAKEPTSNPVSSSPSFARAGSFSEYFFGKNNWVDSTSDAWMDWKKRNHLPISFGAHHWWNVDRDQFVYGDGYGVPGLRGTYFYYLNFDPKLTIQGDHFFNEIGLHIQGRIRDDQDKLRSFYDNNYWTFEAYAFAKTDLGTFKAGQIVEQFGIAWDNSWWEGVAYFDEYRFNPSWGVTWENIWNVSDTFSIPTNLQYYWTSDRVSGALANASAATTIGLEEHHSFILRAIPTWKLNADTTLAWGMAGLTRSIRDEAGFGVDDRQIAWETDLTLTWKNFSVWAQYTDSYGVITPARYLSRGPSDRQNSFSTGVNYKLGPLASIHLNYSKGWDHNPSGEQFLVQPGITFQLTKNIALYTEYVFWDLTNASGNTVSFADGFQFAVVWSY